jgi:hypothetical protein
VKGFVIRPGERTTVILSGCGRLFFPYCCTVVCTLRLRARFDLSASRKEGRYPSASSDSNSQASLLIRSEEDDRWHRGLENPMSWRDRVMRESRTASDQQRACAKTVRCLSKHGMGFSNPISKRLCIDIKAPPANSNIDRSLAMDPCYPDESVRHDGEACCQEGLPMRLMLEIGSNTIS